MTMRVVAYREGDENLDRFKIPQANDTPWFKAATTGDWPGDPVALEWDMPKGPRFLLEPDLNGSAVVRYRRLTPPGPQLGIVVGSSWRWEGTLTASAMRGPKRSVTLYEVALQPPQRATKSLIALVHPRDLQLVDGDTVGVPAPTRAAVAAARSVGRLGGR